MQIEFVQKYEIFRKKRRLARETNTVRDRKLYDFPYSLVSIHEFDSITRDKLYRGKYRSKREANKQTARLIYGINLGKDSCNLAEVIFLNNPLRKRNAQLARKRFREKASENSGTSLLIFPIPLYSALLCYNTAVK